MEHRLLGHNLTGEGRDGTVDLLHMSGLLGLGLFGEGGERIQQRIPHQADLVAHEGVQMIVSRQDGGENVTLFVGGDALPQLHGKFGTGSAEEAIPHHSAAKTDILGDQVHLVNRQSALGGNEHPCVATLGEKIQKLAIAGLNALKQEAIVAVGSQRTLFHSDSLYEIEAVEGSGTACQHIVDECGQLFPIKGSGTVEVDLSLAFGVGNELVTRTVEIVQRNNLHPASHLRQACDDTVSGGSFTCAGRPCQCDNLTGVCGNAIHQPIQTAAEISLASGGEGSQRGFVTVKGEFYGFHGSSSFTME